MRISSKAIQHLQSTRSHAGKHNACIAGINQSYRTAIDQSWKLIKESRNAIEAADAVLERGWMWQG